MNRLALLWQRRARLWPVVAGTMVAIAAALALAVGGAEPGTATTPPTAAATDKAAIERIVREYILANPEIIPQAIANLQNREVEKLLAARRADIETPFASAWAGASGQTADVTLVEFYDFACPYCRAAKADVERLVREDRRLRVVYRDFPVISEPSREAATASLSAAAQGHHAAFYRAMFDLDGRVNHEKVVAAVRRAGLDEIRTARDLAALANKAEIAKNIDLGRALGLTGTPAYVVGNRILSGAVGYDQLKAAVAEARARPAPTSGDAL